MLPIQVETVSPGCTTLGVSWNGGIVVTRTPITVALIAIALASISLPAHANPKVELFAAIATGKLAPESDSQGAWVAGGLAAAGVGPMGVVMSGHCLRVDEMCPGWATTSVALGGVLLAGASVALATLPDEDRDIGLGFTLPVMAIATASLALGIGALMQTEPPSSPHIDPGEDEDPWALAPSVMSDGTELYYGAGFSTTW